MRLLTHARLTLRVPVVGRLADVGVSLGLWSATVL